MRRFNDKRGAGVARIWATCLVTGALALGIAACGGSSAPSGTGNVADPSGASAGSSSASTPAGSPKLVATHPNGSRVRDKVRYHQGPSRARPPIEGTDDDEVNETGAGIRNPCRLVTRAEAGTIVKRPIASMGVAQQGPTCIYRPRGATTYITLALQSANLKLIRQHSRPLARVDLASRKGYCVKYGSVMLYVGLPGGKALNVTAPCQTAARFASRALQRLRLR